MTPDRWVEHSAAVPVVMAVAILVRLAVGLHSYSGAGMPPTYGDYEAQRHWMEITINTPVSQWYTETDHNPLQYWGLDYPPLTAYQSWLCGKVLHKLEPGAVALGSSRGYETPSSKTYLRWSVIAFDVLVFFPAAYACLKVFGRQRSRTQQLWLLLAVLMQPAAVLIDHGHFQYNNISLGLSAGAAAAVAGGWECLGSMLYCLSLNHKQMSLFFAPAFFAHLLGKCLQQPSYSGKALSVLKLGAVVMAAFAACWAPFLTSRQSALQVLHRLMPVRRGLFEDYVANFWCATHIAIKWKQIFSKEALVRVCAVTTLVAASPAMLQQLRCPSPRGLLICMANSSLAFFLFAYQVHEKSILLPLLPVTLLAAEEVALARWVPAMAAFSMYPLLKRDGLTLAYMAMLLFWAAVAMPGFVDKRHRHHQLFKPDVHVLGNGLRLRGSLVPHVGQSVLQGLLAIKEWAACCVPVASIVLAVAIHIAEAAIVPPERYPYVFDAAFICLGFVHFAGLAVYLNWRQWQHEHPADKPKSQ